MEESDRFPNAQKLSQQAMVMALGEVAALHEQNPGRTMSERTKGDGWEAMLIWRCLCDIPEKVSRRLLNIWMGSSGERSWPEP